MCLSREEKINVSFERMRGIGEGEGEGERKEGWKDLTRDERLTRAFMSAAMFASAKGTIAKLALVFLLGR